MKSWITPTVTIVTSVIPTVAHSTIYLSVEEAQRILFPHAQFQPLSLHLTEEQKKAIEEFSGAPFSPGTVQVWKAIPGGYFFVDRVLGKHQYFTYALALGPKGEILGLEILTYSESHGGEVRRPAWKTQFLGKRFATPPQWQFNITNITGATLSCKHLTSGVRRLLAIYHYALAR